MRFEWTAPLQTLAVRTVTAIDQALTVGADGRAVRREGAGRFVGEMPRVARVERDDRIEVRLLAAQAIEREGIMRLV